MATEHRMKVWLSAVIVLAIGVIIFMAYWRFMHA